MIFALWIGHEILFVADIKVTYKLYLHTCNSVFSNLIEQIVKKRDALIQSIIKLANLFGAAI